MSRPAGWRAELAGRRVDTGALRLALDHDAVEQAYDEAVLERLNTDELTGLLARRKFDVVGITALAQRIQPHELCLHLPQPHRHRVQVFAHELLGILRLLLLRRQQQILH